MKVALLVERFERYGGGLEQWTWAMAHALAERGHDVTVLAFVVPEPPSDSITLRLLPWQAGRLARAATADALLATLDIDVAHDLGIGRTAPILHPQSGSRLANEWRERRALPLLRRLAAAVNPRRRHWLREVRQFEESRYVETTDSIVIAVSRLVADDLRAWHGVAPDRIRLVPNAIDTRRFTVPSPGERERWREQLGVGGRTMFLFSAHNPRLKGLGPLLAAFSRARAERPELMLTAIGKAPDRETRRTVRRLRLAEAVLFPGSVKDPLPYYAAADAFVLPSWHDACSLTVLEACACGLPVITTRTNGVADLLVDGQEGRIIGSAGDVGALAAAIEELSSAQVRARMAARAVATAARHDFSRNVDDIERVYADVVRRKRAATGAGEGNLP